MITTLSLVALWLISGLAALIWFHRWRNGAGYAKRWHIIVDHAVTLLLGPVSLVIMWKRDAIARRMRGTGGGA